MVKKSEAATTFIEYQYMWSAVRMKYFTSLLSASRLLTASTVDERSMLSFETASPRTTTLLSCQGKVLEGYLQKRKFYVIVRLFSGLEIDR